MAHVKNAIGMKKQIAGFVAILIGITSVGLSPAFALDERGFGKCLAVTNSSGIDRMSTYLKL